MCPSRAAEPQQVQRADEGGPRAARVIRQPEPIRADDNVVTDDHGYAQIRSTPIEPVSRDAEALRSGARARSVEDVVTALGTWHARAPLRKASASRLTSDVTTPPHSTPEPS